MSAASLLVAQDLQVGRAEVLLRAVTLRIEPGQWWFVLGRNGAGKSTLVATLLGLLPALGGRIARAGDIEDRIGLGYVPQQLHPPAPLPVTVREFVALGLWGIREQPAQLRERAAQALRTMHIDELGERQAGQLSLGQLRRALVARALARRPRLMVLDEPTANLDAHGSAALCADLERLRRNTLALLHVSHDLRLVRAFATHVALVHDGAVSAGTAAAMLASDELHAALGREQAR